MASRKGKSGVGGSRKTSDAESRFAYEGLDRVLHEKARLGILTALLTEPEGRLFNELKELCALTDGNLARHLQVLHDAELVEMWKSTETGRPKTLVRLSLDGRAAFLSYLEQLESVIRDARGEERRRAKARERRRDLDAPPGFAPA